MTTNALTTNSASITTLQQQIDAIAATAVNLDELEAQLGQLYTHYEAAGDTNALALIQQNWQLANHAVQANQTAMAAVAVAQKFAEQRDEIAEEYDILHEEHQELAEAVIYHDTSHPLVEDLIDTVEYDARRDGEESGFDAGYDSAGMSLFEKAVSQLMFYCHADRHTATVFANLLINDTVDTANTAILREIGALIDRLEE